MTLLLTLVLIISVYAQSCPHVHKALEAQSMAALGLSCGSQGVDCEVVQGDCHFVRLDGELLVDEETVSNLTFPFLVSSKGLKILQAVQLTYFDLPIYNSTRGYPFVLSGSAIETMTLPSLVLAGSITLNSPSIASLSLPELRTLQAFDNGDALISVSDCSVLKSVSLPNLESIVSTCGSASITSSASPGWDVIFPALTSMTSNGTYTRVSVQGPNNVRFPLLKGDYYFSVSIAAGGCFSSPYIDTSSTGSINSGATAFSSYANIPPNTAIGLGPSMKRQTC